MSNNQKAVMSSPGIAVGASGAQNRNPGGYPKIMPASQEDELMIELKGEDILFGSVGNLNIRHTYKEHSSIVTLYLALSKSTDLADILNGRLKELIGSYVCLSKDVNFKVIDIISINGDQNNYDSNFTVELKVDSSSIL
jgi:hypothetical protein